MCRYVLLTIIAFVRSALSDNEPVYAQVERHHKTARTPEPRSQQRTHRRHLSACVPVPPVESSADGPDVPVREQLVSDLNAATAADPPLKASTVVRRKSEIS